MNRNLYSSIGHKSFSFCNPINERKFDKLISLMGLSPDDKVIDFGAGKFELLIKLVEKHRVKAIGVELSSSFCEEAKKQVETRIPFSTIDIINGDANQFVNTEHQNSYALSACIGSTHAFDGFTAALEVLKKSVKSGGYILIGDCYWKSEPRKEYQEALGADKDIYNSHPGNIKAGEELGLSLLWSTVASPDEWDEYECGYFMSIEDYCFNNPEAPHAKEFLKRAKTWRDLYFSMGRDTLGFGLYLFRKL